MSVIHEIFQVGTYLRNQVAPWLCSHGLKNHDCLCAKLETFRFVRELMGVSMY